MSSRARNVGGVESNYDTSNQPSTKGDKTMKIVKHFALVAACVSLIFSASAISTQASTSGINPLQSPQPTPNPTTPPGTTVVCTTLTAVNVRAAPSIRARRIGGLRRGTRFVCLTRVGNWLKLRFGGGYGWVYRPLVTCNRQI
jgi:hypothetical protein